MAKLRSILAALTAAATLITLGACTAPREDLYPTAGTVVEVNREEDTVTVMDAAGNLWTFAQADDWQVGDLAALLMDGHNTENITDDEIISVRYAG